MPRSGQAKVIQVILSECISKEQEVYQFLQSCVNPLTPSQAQAFMDYSFNPESMFCYVLNNEFQALLQTYRRTLIFSGRKTSVYIIARGFYKKGCKSKLDELIEAAIATASKSSLFILADTREPSLYRRLGFGKVSTQVESEMIEVYALQTDSQKVRLWDREEDLYPLYLQFMSFFDGSIRLSEQEFMDCLEARSDFGDKIYICGEPGNVKAMAIASPHPEGILLSTLIYSDPGGLLELLRYFDSLYDVVRLRYSKAENLDALADLEVFPQSSLMMKICDLAALNRWQNTNAETFEDVFKQLQAPQWNYLY